MQIPKRNYDITLREKRRMPQIFANKNLPRLVINRHPLIECE